MGGKIALVTGSSRGIGEAIAALLAKNDYIVYVNGRTAADVDRACEKIGANARSLVGDMTLPGEIDGAVNKILADEGRIDLAIANIGSGRSQNGWNIPIEEYRRMFDLNFFSAANLFSSCLAPMSKAGSGHLIAIASIAGCECLGAPLAYSAAKTALISFVKNLSARTAEIGVRANAVSPGNVMFPGSAWDEKMKADEIKTKEYVRRNVPLNGFASPADIAGAVLFLEGSGFMTGSNLIIDGGQTKKII